MSGDRPMGQDRPTTDVAVAIVGYRCAEAIRACLEHLNRSTVPVGAVCICENGGPEAFAELAAALRAGLACAEAGADPEAPPEAAESLVLRPGRPGAVGAVRLYRAGANLGYAGAVNLVIAALAPRPDWSALWVLNPDTLPTPTALAAVRDRNQWNSVPLAVVYGSPSMSQPPQAASKSPNGRVVLAPRRGDSHGHFNWVMYFGSAGSK